MSTPQDPQDPRLAALLRESWFCAALALLHLPAPPHGESGYNAPTEEVP